MNINASRASAVVLILLSVFFLYIARSYPSDAGFFPRMLLAGIIVLSVVLIIRSFQFDPYKASLVLKQKKQVAICALLATVYIAAMPYVGYYAASAAFILLFSAYLRFQNRIVPVIVAAAFPLTIYVVFEYLLNIPVPSIGA
jgi:glucose-6-phosphate-specific signal transduction histidine kinase